MSNFCGMHALKELPTSFPPAALIKTWNSFAQAVYRKSLRLAPSARQNSTVGEIVNFMQLDAGRLETLPASIHTIWDSAFQVTFCDKRRRRCACMFRRRGRFVAVLPTAAYAVLLSWVGRGRARKGYYYYTVSRVRASFFFPFVRLKEEDEERGVYRMVLEALHRRRGGGGVWHSAGEITWTRLVGW